MTRWTSRRRIVLLGVLALTAGYLLKPLPGWLLLRIEGWWWAGTVCRASGIDVVCVRAHSAADYSRPLFTAGFLLAVGLLSLWVFRSVAKWCLRPVHNLVLPIAQVGPQNLGYRVRPAGKDELADLSRAIDEMMDRIAAGYDGQRRFAANASHELRTPLAVQRALIEVGMAQPMTGDQVELLTAQLLQTNERNERLIEGLLALSESDEGLRSHDPQQLDDIVAGVLDSYQQRAGSAEVTITAVLKPRVVRGERVLLERLVTNLVENAIKYNRAGGTVAVAVGESPALTVTNTGQPIPAEAVSALFEPFRRLSSDRIAHGGGAGLGLAIARSITQAHDGTISAEPASDGGLRVDVRLPDSS